MSPAALDTLAALDRALLHVLVVGPGYGEGIAVALPERGWLIIDGCRVVGGAFPLRTILERWRGDDDPIDVLAVTHPHTDHAYGVRELLEQHSPRAIGLATAPGDPALVFRAVEAELARGGPGLADQLARRTVLDAMLALRRRFDAAPGDLIALVDGSRLPLSTTRAAAHVRAPDAALVHARLMTNVAADANELSAVIELVYGATSVVLGSDLPRTSAAGTGWNAVVGRHPHVGAHHALKIPHHGSPAAFHPALMTAGAARPWWISPFNRGVRLPPTSPDGIQRLVGLNGEVALTATPRAQASQPSHVAPGRVPLGALAALFQAERPPIGPGAFSVTPPALEALDAVWCAAFDDRGAVRGLWRGARAFAVVP